MLEVQLVNAEVLVPQEYYNMFMLMIQRGVFKQKNATVSLDFDKNGTLAAIRRNDFLFSVRELQK